MRDKEGAPPRRRLSGLEQSEKSADRKTGSGPVLRSRGFLSHGGAPAPTQEGAGETPPSRARARRSHEGVGERAPRALDLPAPRRPYDLEDE